MKNHIYISPFETFFFIVTEDKVEIAHKAHCFVSFMSFQVT